MSKINVSGLKNIRDKLQKYKKITATDIALAVAEKGKDLAQEKYGGASVVVTAETLGEGKARISAKGKGVAFLEYGTGRVGEGTYKGKLPTQPITFESGGETHTTEGWEYYYDNPKTKVTQNGQEGWIANKTFFTGQAAQAQMWKTANELIGGEARKAIEELIESNGG